MKGQHVQDVMTAEVVTVPPDAGFKHIVDVLADSGVSAVPVVSDGVVVGLVSEADLLHKMELAGAAPGAHLFHRRATRSVRDKAAAETAADLMTAPAVTIKPDAPIGAAARLMEQHRIKRLPVVDAAGTLVGIVSRRDLLRRYLRPDAEIREEIVEDVVLRTMWVDPADVDVTVAEGRVTLSGTLDRRSTVEIARHLIRAVDGVVAVADDLTWRFDDLTVRDVPPMFTP